MGVGEMLYLLAVALLWFWVGRYLDRKKGLEVSEAHSSKWRWILPRMSALGWGVFLLLWNAATLDDAFPVLFLGRRLFRIDAAIVRVLFLLWSVFLIALPLIALTRDLNRKRSG
jgi:hypothetical protein